MVYNLTHIADLDGMASAALVVHYLGVPVENVIFIDHGGRAFQSAMESVSAIEGRGNLLIISDFSMTKENSKAMDSVLSGFQKRGNMIIWIDHHPWESNLVNKASRYCDLMIVGENPYFCGTELVYRLLCKKDRFGDELARVTHLSDFWIRSRSKKDNDLVGKVAYGMRELRSRADGDRMLHRFVSEIAKGNLDCEIIRDAYKKYLKTTRPLLRKMLDSSTIIQVKKIRIGVGFGRLLSSQEACMAIIEKKRCNIGVYISEESLHGSIRSVRDPQNWGIDISKLAKSANGGGHPLAAGISFEHDGYDPSNESHKEQMVERIRKAAARIYSKKVPYFQNSTGKTAMR